MSHCTMGKLKTGSKKVNFDKSLLCGCWPKIHQIWHRAASKSKKMLGVFTQVKKALAKRICFYKRYILRKHPQIAKKKEVKV